MDTGHGSGFKESKCQALPKKKRVMPKSCQAKPRDVADSDDVSSTCLVQPCSPASPARKPYGREVYQRPCPVDACLKLRNCGLNPLRLNCGYTQCTLADKFLLSDSTPIYCPQLVFLILAFNSSDSLIYGMPSICLFADVCPGRDFSVAHRIM